MRFKFKARPSAGVLYVVIGSERLDCAMLHGGGRRIRGLPGERIGIPLPPSADEAALLETIAIAGDDLSARIRSTVREIRVLIADCWLAQTRVPWTVAMKRRAPAQINAAAMIEQAGFDGDWAKPIALDDAPYGKPRLAAAYPQTIIAGLERLGVILGTRLGSVLPFSVAAWETLPRRRKPSSALAILDRGLLILCNSSGFRSGRLGEITLRRYPPDEDAARSLRETWQRMRLRQPELATLESVAVLTLDDATPRMPGAPFEALDMTDWPGDGLPASLRLAARASAVRHSLDAITQYPRPSPGVRVALALGAVLLAAMTGLLISNAREISALTARMEEIRPAPAPVITEPAWNRDELPRVLAVNAAIRELNLPVAAILGALQPPPDIRVAVLGIDASAAGESTSSIKVFAEAPTGTEMARYVNCVSTRRPFTHAYLNKHEIIETAAGQSYRFVVEVRWSD